MTIQEVNQSIKVARRLTGKTPLSLLRFKATLIHLREWKRKAKLAETKIKKYTQKVKRYERRYKGDDRNGTTLR